MLNSYDISTEYPSLIPQKQWQKNEKRNCPTKKVKYGTLIAEQYTAQQKTSFSEEKIRMQANGFRNLVYD